MAADTLYVELDPAADKDFPFLKNSNLVTAGLLREQVRDKVDPSTGLSTAADRMGFLVLSGGVQILHKSILIVFIFLY